MATKLLLLSIASCVFLNTQGFKSTERTGSSLLAKQDEFIDHHNSKFQPNSPCKIPSVKTKQ